MFWRCESKQNYFQFQNQVYKQNTGLALGPPSSSTFSELYLQYLEHTITYDILLRHNIMGYFRYVDDILIAYDSNKTNISEVLNSFNVATHPLNFTIEKEQNIQLNFLDITIKKENNLIKSDIYRKPTGTDILIPLEACHPKHISSAIWYLQDRNKTCLTDAHSKRQEQYIHHILLSNHYDPNILRKLKDRQHDTEPNSHKKKWAKCTYVGKETRYITKLFKISDVRIAFTTKHNLRHLLQNNHNNTARNLYNKSGVYKLMCTECEKRYIGQTGSHSM
jgi:hypothetical protein